MSLLPKLFSKMCFVFHDLAIDDVMTFAEKLKSDYLKNQKSFQSEIKKFFFQKSPLLDKQNKIGKM